MVGARVAVGETVAVAVALASWPPVGLLWAPVESSDRRKRAATTRQDQDQESVSRRRGCARNLERRVGAESDGCGQWGASAR